MRKGESTLPIGDCQDEIAGANICTIPTRITRNALQIRPRYFMLM